jgi:hypothetical protein
LMQDFEVLMQNNFLHMQNFLGRPSKKQFETIQTTV